MLKAKLIDDFVRGKGVFTVADTLGFVLENTGDETIKFGFSEHSQNIAIEPQSSRTFEVGLGVLYNVKIYFDCGVNSMLIIQTKPHSKEVI